MERRWPDAGLLQAKWMNTASRYHALSVAVNIPYDQVVSLTRTLLHDQPIVVYCIHSTYRAPEAARTLQAAGFGQVFVLEGGIVAWQVAGFTIQAEDLAKAPTILPDTARCSNKPKLKL